MSAYDEKMTEQDQKLLKQYQSEWQAANAKGDEAGKLKAHAQAEALRKSYGYSGGADGSRYEAIPGYEGLAQVKTASENIDKAYDSVAKSYEDAAEAQKQEIDKQTAAYQKQAYIDNQMSKKNLDQNLRASGITGGLSETSKVSLENNYRTNRNNTDTAAIEAKKDIELSKQQQLAQNELNRANAKYNADMTVAQFEQSAAANNRSIEQAELSKYYTFIQNGWVDSTNVAKIAAALGVSEDAVTKASKAAANADYQNMALNLLSAGIYDESFVNLFGGRFSAETLKEYANQQKKTVISSGNTQKYTVDIEDEYQDNENKIEKNVKGNSKEYAIGADLTTSVDTFTYNELMRVAKKYNYLSDLTDLEKSQVASQLGLSVAQLEKIFKGLKESAIGSIISY
jgi:hypothetical protein